MGIFDKLLHSSSPGPGQEPPRSPASRNNGACPYCGVQLTNPPKRKIACPECKSPIYVRTTQRIFDSNLLTEEQALAADFFKDLEYQGATVEDFNKARNELAKRWNTDPKPYDIVWRVSNGLVVRVQNPGMVTFSQALYQLKRGNDPAPYLRAKYKSEAGTDDRKFTIVTNGCCTVCSELEGKVITAKEIATSQPLPNPKCTHKLAKNDKYSWCVCMYAQETALSHLTT